MPRYLATGSGPRVPSQALIMRHYLREKYRASLQAQPGKFRLCYSRDVYCSAGCIKRTQDSNGPVYVSAKQRVPNHPLCRRFTHTSPKSRSVPGHVAPVAVHQDASMTSPQQPPPPRSWGRDGVVSRFSFATVCLYGPGPPQLHRKLNRALLTGTMSAPQINFLRA